MNMMWLCSHHSHTGVKPYKKYKHARFLNSTDNNGTDYPMRDSVNRDDYSRDSLQVYGRLVGAIGLISPTILKMLHCITRLDKALLFIGLFASVITGACLPILGYFFGSMTNIFVREATQGLSSNTTNAYNLTGSDYLGTRTENYTNVVYKNKSVVIYEIVHAFKRIFAKNVTNILDDNSFQIQEPIPLSEFHAYINMFTIIYIVIGTAMLISSFIQTVCWELVSERLVHRLRKMFFNEIMGQDISWYDANENGNLPNKLSDDLERVREGFGSKCSMILQHVSALISGLGVGLFVNARLTLVILCVGPFIIFISGYIAKMVTSSAAREQEKYAAAGAIAEDALSNIKTVSAFGGQQVEVDRYEKALEAGRKIAISKYNKFGIALGLMFFIMYSVYGIGFWYGSYLIQIGVSNPGSVFTVFFSVIVGAFSIGSALPYVNMIGSAIGITSSIFSIMDRKTEIDPYSDEGSRLIRINGHIEFKNVSFNYPSRSNVKILKNLNLDINPGKTVAIVGPSGAGKSTVIGLLLRYYNPINGAIYLDGAPISGLNINWLRRQVGFVSQEPVLFGVSISENIRYGKEDATFGEIEDAAKLANAHKFIKNLPKGYDTIVGDAGSLLSGGQKQRIAIARALVRDPKVLLLDEATSALDAKSEAIVQKALENAMQGRTTIIVAHRLSTIKNADTIYVMEDGHTVEYGNHDELMEKKGLYYNLVITQLNVEEQKEALDGAKMIILPDNSQVENIPTLMNIDEDGDHDKPSVTLKKFETGDRTYDKKFRMDSNIDEKDLKPLEEFDDQIEQGKPWKVLKRSVSTENISDSEEDDDEYETVITRVRETREVLYDNDSDDENQSSTDPSIPHKDNRKSSVIPEIAEEDNDDSIHTISEDEIELPQTQLVSTEEKLERNVNMWELICLQKPEWPYLFLGFFGSALTGIIIPVFAIYYGQVFTTFTLSGEALKHETVFWTYMFFLLAILSGFAFWSQAKGMTESSEKLIKRVRVMVFENILRQPVSWFDMETSSVGILVTRLARDAPLVRAAAGTRAGQVLSSAVTLLCAVTVAFVYGWQLASVLIICVPVIIFASYRQQVLLKKNQLRDSKLMEEAGRVASESVRNIRTVQALGQEKLFTDIYAKSLEKPHYEGKKQAFLYSIIYSSTQAIIYYMYALAFRIGGYFLETGEMEATNIYRVFFALAFTASSVGSYFSYLQDYSKAKLSSRLLFYLMKKKSDVDASSFYGARPGIKGKISFHNVHFTYPTRLDVTVLNGINFVLQPGKTLALVGESGCGKSTIVSLLERFYEPTEGVIEVDDYDIRTMNISHLRAHIGIVTQEPILFDCSIKDNIKYGAVALNTDDIPFELIEKASKIANIHNFVINLPQGYDTLVGERGVQLSGGQKQRVAIARAIIRDPKILLLDEATSALDAESEKIVQNALDVARQGRTTIIIAHRLSTIQNADIICVIHKGKIIEQGTHATLKKLKGHYYQLTQREAI